MCTTTISTIYPFIAMLTICFISSIKAQQAALSCRDRSDHLRQDGGLCFEIPPWQHQPVDLEQHINRLKARWVANWTETRRQFMRPNHLVLANSEISRYVDTVLAPFLDTYQRNIQNAYQQLTTKILRLIKEAINNAINRKQQIYTNLTKLADELNVPASCDEERRHARTISSNHVAQIYACTEEARASIGEMAKYAEEMITITRSHMQSTLSSVASALEDSGQNNSLTKVNITTCLIDLSRAAAQLGYELDLSLTNARRHNEQSCEKLANCGGRARRYTEEKVSELKDHLYQCVYA